MAPSIAQDVPSEEVLHDIAELKLNRAFDPSKHTSVSHTIPIIKPSNHFKV
jgi:sulfonate dioxygenase